MLYGLAIKCTKKYSWLRIISWRMLLIFPNWSPNKISVRQKWPKNGQKWVKVVVPEIFVVTACFLEFNLKLTKNSQKIKLKETLKCPNRVFQIFNWKIEPITWPILKYSILWKMSLGELDPLFSYSFTLW